MGTIKENNKLIAIFMGLNPCDDRDQYHSTLYTNVTDDLTYHKSWDSLMPVALKIVDEYSWDCIAKRYTIEEIYKSVVQFLNFDVYEDWKKEDN